MKRTALLTILLTSISTLLSAQTAYDALMLSENNYEGTARSVAMGNAFTALGGDLGAVSINPAGSAIANYSQVTITPGLTITSSTTQGVPPVKNGDLPFFQKKYQNTRTRIGLPNVGFTINFDTGRTYGIKNVSFGVIMNQTASYDSDLYASGTNSTTSFAGQMAYEASMNRCEADKLGSDDAYNLCSWKDVIGYQSGIFDPYKDYFVAATEVVNDSDQIYLAGDLDQAYGRQTKGGKYEYIINASMNISDFVYVGCNLGMTSVSYSYNEYFKESAINSNDFLIEYKDDDGNITSSKYFESMKYSSSYTYNGTGFFAKFGVLLKPLSWLRLGAAIQTPTVTKIQERWECGGETQFSGRDAKNYSALSPYGENSWTLRSPLRANFGAAFALNNLALLSVDYELSNYGNIKYQSSRFTDKNTLEAINDEIKGAYGIAHNLRVGAEIKPLPFLAIRAGYGLNSSAEKKSGILTHKGSFGLGFSTNGSFFADIACSSTFLPKEYFMPYNDYVFKEGTDKVDENYYAPEILIKNVLTKVVLTLGFRF